MGRELKRVPLDFSWPQGKIWYGYSASLCKDGDYGFTCEECKEFAKLKNIPMTTYDCPNFDKYLGPPDGEGFQLWETTSEGSPNSPVFKTLDELCEWCAENATTFGRNKATKEQWLQMLDANFVFHKQGNLMFI